MYRFSAAAILACLFLASTSEAQPSLKDVFAGHFMIGAALNRKQFTGIDKRGEKIVTENFNTISPENILKWQSVQPKEGKFDFSGADRYVEFGERNRMFVVGHTLVWHKQTPEWVFEGPDGKPASKELLTQRLKTHISTVVGRYKGRIGAWDVVNEALEEDGSLRRSPWLAILGEDYISLAFRFAHEADPTADLYYNDYSLENESKRQGAIRLVRRLQAEQVRISGIGTQSHHKIDWPTVADQERTIVELGGLGIKLAITELDIDVLPPSRVELLGVAADDRNREPDPILDPFKKGFPGDKQAALADRYAEIFRVFVRHRKLIDRVTFWCVTDGDSWLNNWPVRGRSNHPLLWDRKGSPKAALYSVVGTAAKAN